MKKMLKRLSIALMMLVFAMGLTACSEGEAEESTVDSYIVETLEASCQSVVEVLPTLTEADIDAFLASGDAFTIVATNAWLDNGDELGEFVEINSSTVEEDEGAYMLYSDVAFAKKNATVSMRFDETGVPTYMSIEVQYSFGELMGQAGMNTIMGIGIVFLMLLFLSLLISLFKYIGIIAEKLEKKNAPKASAPASKAATPVVTVPTEELVDDKELVAVIAAAIAAYENTSTDSFVVRSIRRKPNNKWSRA